MRPSDHRRKWVRHCWLSFVIALSAPHVSTATGAPAFGLEAQIERAEYITRQARIYEEVTDGILVLHARSAPKAMEQWGFVQDPSFLYFTGLGELPGAILALDGVRREARLFVPPPPISFGMPVPDIIPTSNGEAPVNDVASWTEFQPWLDSRIADGVTTVYVDEPRQPETHGAPEGMRRVEGPLALWREALEERFPTARIRSAKLAIQAQRWTKSPAEVAVLRRNARATAAAVLAVARGMSPGLTQRRLEGTVVSTCLEQGMEGPSFWPWVMSGPNAHMEGLVSAFYRYRQLDRALQAGELVRVDIGCASGSYGGDVGRTLPVSGRFSQGQREVWDLLIAAYRAGLAAMVPGAQLDQVRAASVAAIRTMGPTLTTETGRMGAATMLDSGNALWHIHGVGIESGEDPGPVLEIGVVLAYEPTLIVGPDAFYLEDMILITETGAEVLSAGLPYTAAEIEAVMAESPARDPS